MLSRKTYRTEEFLSSLKERAAANTALARRLAGLPRECLHLRPRPDAWNALECFEHLNRVDQVYLPRIEAALKSAPPATGETYVSGRIGRYIAGSMRPEPGFRKVPTFTGLDPSGTQTDPSVITTWLGHADTLEDLLDRARFRNLSAVSIKSMLGTLIRFRLGDALKMVVNHDWRHLEQARQAAQTN